MPTDQQRPDELAASCAPPVSKRADTVKDVPKPVRSCSRPGETLIARKNLARIMDIVLVAVTQSVRVMVIFEPDHGATKHYDRKR